jgi:hypothetical protein
MAAVIEELCTVLVLAVDGNIPAVVDIVILKVADGITGGSGLLAVLGIVFGDGGGVDEGGSQKKGGQKLEHDGRGGLGWGKD